VPHDARERVQAKLVEVIQIGFALGAEIEGDVDRDVTFKRLPFPLSARFPLILLLQRFARWSAIKINNLEDVHCVRDTGVAG
jgi:hypothetical protein